MARLDEARQERLEPTRLQKAIEEVEKRGYEITSQDDQCIYFKHKNHTITYWAYSGWATGKSIKDGRGLKNLLKQLAPVLQEYPIVRRASDDLKQWREEQEMYGV